MSYPYPQDRHRDRQEKGTQPYQDNREAMSQTREQIQAGAELHGETHRDESDDERRERLESEMQERFAEINREIASEHENQAVLPARPPHEHT